jgi:hypothetical protein
VVSKVVRMRAALLVGVVPAAQRRERSPRTRPRGRRDDWKGLRAQGDDLHSPQSRNLESDSKLRGGDLNPSKELALRLRRQKEQAARFAAIGNTSVPISLERLATAPKKELLRLQPK